MDKVKTVVSDYERCVLCGNLTNVKKNTPLEYRPHYVIGAGEICEECAEQLKENDDPNELRMVE